MSSRNAELKEKYIKKEVSRNLLKHPCQDQADHLVEKTSDYFRHVRSIDIVNR
jgi:hypothetical protein